MVMIMKLRCKTMFVVEHPAAAFEIFVCHLQVASVVGLPVNNMPLNTCIVHHRMVGQEKTSISKNAVLKIV